MRRARALCALAALGLILGMLWLGSKPIAVGAVGEGWDKLAHISLHLCVSLLLVTALGLRRGLWALLACAIFGAVDEILQGFYPGRSMSIADWSADMVGALLGLALAHLAARQARLLQLLDKRR